MLTPFRKLAQASKEVTDLQTIAAQTIGELQASPLAQARLISITLPTSNSVDIHVTHNFGRPILGYFIAKIPATTKAAFPGVTPVLSDSPNLSAQPSVYALLRLSGLFQTVGGPFTITISVF